MRDVLRSDVGVYVVSGAFCVLVFLTGLVLVPSAASIELGAREFAGFAIGFTLFVTSYFVSMAVYRALSE